MGKAMEKVNLSSLADKWPSAIVARSAMKAFSGGLISPKTMANTDSGLTRIRKGSKVFYFVSELIPWIESQCEVIRKERTIAELLEMEK